MGEVGDKEFQFVLYIIKFQQFFYNWAKAFIYTLNSCFSRIKISSVTNHISIGIIKHNKLIGIIIHTA